MISQAMWAAATLERVTGGVTPPPPIPRCCSSQGQLDRGLSPQRTSWSTSSMPSSASAVSGSFDINSGTSRSPAHLTSAQGRPRSRARFGSARDPRGPRLRRRQLEGGEQLAKDRNDSSNRRCGSAGVVLLVGMLLDRARTAFAKGCTPSVSLTCFSNSLKTRATVHGRGSPGSKRSRSSMNRLR